MTSTPYPVSPAHIERELKKIWESLETKNITRACLFNLLFLPMIIPVKPTFKKLFIQ